MMAGRSAPHRKIAVVALVEVFIREFGPIVAPISQGQYPTPRAGI
ncbi:hypothetical protein QN239_12385 [Mycolicibacterium sp. Y3]